MSFIDYSRMSFEEILNGIRDLTIQGATQIAIAAVYAFELKLAENVSLEKLKDAVNQLSNARSTEPALRNALSYCLLNISEGDNKFKNVKLHFQESNEVIAKFGNEKILNGMKIFTHCHSSSVEDILIYSHKQNKHITVLNTETRPRFQGRITALNLAKRGISVKHFVDSAAFEAIKVADMCLFGADSIDKDGNVINKIGTSFMVDIANYLNKPVYICTNSWKLNTTDLKENIEYRTSQEVWDIENEFIEVINPAFDLTYADKITAMITELGICKPSMLNLQVKERYSWLNNDISTKSISD